MDVNNPDYSGMYPWATERADLLARIAELETQAAMLREALGVQVRVQGCTCGARPESPSTHPHVLGCPVEQALAASEKEAK